jgi:(2Fe-2S) ferredoxin
MATHVAKADASGGGVRLKELGKRKSRLTGDSGPVRSWNAFEFCTRISMPKFEKHIFICGNQRPAGHPRGCCDLRGKAKLQKLFKQKLAERGLKGKVRANQSGCLDQCEHGPNLVVYPDAVWYGHVTEADVDEIIESHIVGGHPVQRLVLADSCLNTQMCEHRTKS